MRVGAHATVRMFGGFVVSESNFGADLMRHHLGVNKLDNSSS
jgi:hypothetical protein